MVVPGACVLFVWVKPATVSSNLVVDYASGIPITGTNMTLSVLFRHLPSAQLAQVQNPILLISAGIPGASLNSEKVLANLQPGQTGQSFDKQWRVTLNSTSE